MTDKHLDAPQAVNRKELARNPPPPSDVWPRTDRRVSRLQAALRRRQPDVTVVLENVHDVYNISAVLRTCDAVGVATVHLVHTVDDRPVGRFSRRVAAGTAKWVDVERWTSVDDCYAHLRQRGLTILATDFTDTALSIYESDFTGPVAFVFGNEMRGLTDEAIAQADREVFLPMKGMVQSLNISVSCAVTLYELQRQREKAGLYDSPRLSEDVIAATLDDWLKK